MSAPPVATNPGDIPSRLREEFRLAAENKDTSLATTIRDVLSEPGNGGVEVIADFIFYVSTQFSFLIRNQKSESVKSAFQKLGTPSNNVRVKLGLSAEKCAGEPSLSDLGPADD